jgi:hypothetical protein
MINFIYARFQKIATGKGLLILGIILIVILVLLLTKPLGVAQLREYSGGVGTLDGEFGYSPQHAYKILDSQGEKGRQVALVILGLDFLFLLTYMLFWPALLIIIYQKWLPASNGWQKIALAPVLAGIADCLENILIIIMITNYPGRFLGVATAANVMTISKWSLVGLSLVVTVVGAISIGIQYVSGKKNHTL